MTYIELKAVVDSWVEKYVKQTVDFPTGKAVTEARLEELFNLLIIQGDNSAQGVGYIRDFLTAYMQEMQITVTDNVDNAVAAANTAVGNANTAITNTNAVIDNANQAISDTNTAAQNAQDTATNLETTYAPRLTTVEGKVDTIENEMDVLEATLSQDYKSIFSSGTGKDNTLVEQTFNDKVEGQSSVKIEGFTSQNLITNGDFSVDSNADGLADGFDFFAVGGVKQIINGKQRIYGTNAVEGVYLVRSFAFNTSHKYYIVFDIDTNDTSYQEYFYLANGTAKTLYQSTTKIKKFSAIITPNVGNTEIKLGLFTGVGGVFIHTTTYIEFGNLQVKDLGDSSSSLYNITLEQAQYMNDHYISGLQGVGSHKVVSVGKNLFGGEIAANKIIAAVNNATYAYKTVVDGRNCIAMLGGTNVAFKTVANKFKPNTQYTMQFYAKWASGNTTNGGRLIFMYTDGTATVMSVSGATWTKHTFTSTVGKTIATITTDYGATVNTNYFDYDTMQLEENTVATTVVPYQSSEVITTLPRQLHCLPNKVADTQEEVNKVAQVTYRNMEYTLQASDVKSMYTSYTNLDYARISKPASGIGYGNTLTKWLLINNYPEFDSSAGMDLASNTNQFTLMYHSTDIFVGFTKGTTLEQAQTLLAGTKIIYQLAQPIVYKNGENGFSQVGNLEVYKGGTIYIEPVTPKECSNPKTYITYNLSKQAVVMGNSGELTEIQKFLVGKVLIESGTNTNGRYLKYDDGTLICTINTVLLSLSMLNANGTLFKSLDQTWTYPATFLEISSLSGICTGSDTVFPVGVSTVNLLQYKYRVLRIASATEDIRVELLAIGRWK